ncbi:MAG: hypothetical protein MSA56_00210 [Clostridium sp.]|nr:hypothetical protein [Clostridium sp.]
MPLTLHVPFAIESPYFETPVDGPAVRISQLIVPELLVLVLPLTILKLKVKAAFIILSFGTVNFKQ